MVLELFHIGFVPLRQNDQEGCVQADVNSYYKFSSYSDPLWLPGILNFSVAHAPKSINLHLSEQNGLNLLPLERSASLLQLGHLLDILKGSCS